MVCGYVVSRLTLNVFGLAVSTFQQFLGLENGGVFGRQLLGQEIQVLQVFLVSMETWDGNKGASCCARKKRRKLKVRNLQQNDLL